MSVPDQINDGDWRKPNFETVDIRYPFSERGDGESYEFTPTFTVDKKSYRRPTIGSELDLRDYNLKGYLVNSGSPKDIGDGLFRVTQTYASVPMNRREGTTVSISIPWFTYRREGPKDDSGRRTGPIIFKLETMTRTFSGFNEFEYSLKELKPLTAYAAFMIRGWLYTFPGGDSREGTGGSPFGKARRLAQDSEVGIYKGNIFYRKSTYARIPASGFTSRD